MKKDLKKVALSLVLVVGINTISLAEIVDVDNHWAKSEIDYLNKKNIIVGYGDGSFKPENPVTRAEFFRIVNTTFGYINQEKLEYSDIEDNSWYIDEISKAKAAGYLSIYETNLIDPNRAITREEVASILANIYNLELNNENILDQVYDGGETSPWAMEGIGSLIELGYMSGYEDDSIKPKGEITRAETSRLLKSITGEIINEPGIYTYKTDGNILINSPGVILVGSEVKGNLYLTEGIDKGTVVLDKSGVQGKIYLETSGNSKVELKDSIINEVEISSKNLNNNIKVDIAKGTKISNLKINSLAKLSVEGLINNIDTDIKNLDIEVKDGGKLENIENKLEIKINGEKLKSGSHKDLSNKENLVNKDKAEKKIEKPKNDYMEDSDYGRDRDIIESPTRPNPSKPDFPKEPETKPENPKEPEIKPEIPVEKPQEDLEDKILELLEDLNNSIKDIEDDLNDLEGRNFRIGNFSIASINDNYIAYNTYGASKKIGSIKIKLNNINNSTNELSSLINKANINNSTIDSLIEMIELSISKLEYKLDRLEEYKNIVEEAEQRIDEESLDYARRKLDDLGYGSLRDELNFRLNIVEESILKDEIDRIKLQISSLTSSTSFDIDHIREKINELDELDADYLLELLDEKITELEVEEERETQLQEEINDFKNNYIDILDIDLSLIEIEDKDIVESAIYDYENLSESAKSELSVAKLKLDLLISEINKLEEWSKLLEARENLNEKIEQARLLGIDVEKFEEFLSSDNLNEINNAIGELDKKIKNVENIAKTLEDLKLKLKEMEDIAKDLEVDMNDIFESNSVEELNQKIEEIKLKEQINKSILEIKEEYREEDYIISYTEYNQALNIIKNIKDIDDLNSAVEEARNILKYLRNDSNLEISDEVENFKMKYFEILGKDLNDVSIKHKPLLESALEEYRLLDEKVKNELEMSKWKLTSLLDMVHKLEEEKLEEEKINHELANTVMKKIDDMGIITLDSKALVVDIRKSYNALTEIQKQLVNNINKLIEAEDKIDELEKLELERIEEARQEKIFQDILLAIKNSSSLEELNRILIPKDVSEVRQKDLNKNKEQKKLELQEILDNEIAVNMMNKLSSLGTITLESKNNLENLREEYDNLSDLQKKLVLNIGLLDEAEEKLKNLQVIENAREEAIKSIQEKYKEEYYTNPLNHEEYKNLINSLDNCSSLEDIVDKKKTILAKISSIKIDATLKIEDDINNIPKVIGLDNKILLEGLNRNYINLSEEQKGLVINIDKLEAALLKVKSLEEIKVLLGTLPDSIDGHRDLEESSRITVKSIYDIESKLTEASYKYDKTKLNQLEKELALVEKNGYSAKIGTREFITLEKALEEAVDKDVVVLASDYILSKNTLVKNGVTLLIPVSETDSGYILKQGVNTSPDGKTAGKANLYRSLTIPGNIKLDVEGILLVNAVVGQNNAGYFDQDIRGNYGKIDLNGEINIKNKGLLDVFGHIEGNGKIDVETGGKLGDLYIVRNWRGGSAARASIGKNIYPYNEYDMNNIKVDIKFHSGSSYFGNVKMFASGSYHYTEFYHIDNEKGLLRINDKSYIIKKYIDDRTIIETYGSVEEIGGGMSIVGIPAKTNSLNYPLDGDIDIIVKSGEFKVNNKLKVLPGANIKVEKTGALRIVENAEVFVYDKFDVNYKNNNKTNYPQRDAKSILVDGKLYIDGQLYGNLDINGSMYIKRDTSKFKASTIEVKSVSGSSIFARAEVDELLHEIKIKNNIDLLGYKVVNEDLIEIKNINGIESDGYKLFSEIKSMIEPYILLEELFKKLT